MRDKQGEAVMLAVMGVMIVGGLIYWMFSGHSHMPGMHGGRHPASEVRSGEHHGGSNDAVEGDRGSDGDAVTQWDRLRNTDGDKRSP